MAPVLMTTARDKQSGVDLSGASDILNKAIALEGFCTATDAMATKSSDRTEAKVS